MYDLDLRYQFKLIIIRTICWLEVSLSISQKNAPDWNACERSIIVELGNEKQYDLVLKCKSGRKTPKG